MKNPDYDVFLFDLGRVLVDFDHHISAGKIAPFSDKDECWLYQFFFESELTMQFDEGRISSEEFYAGVKNAIGLRLGYREFVPLWADIFSEKKDMLKFVAGLKKDYRLVLISNVSALHFEFVKKKFPVVSYMDELVLSYEIGAMKPGRRIYQAAIKASAAPANRIIYADDRPELVEGGKSAGINASFVFKNLEQFKTDLEGIGVYTDECIVCK